WSHFQAALDWDDAEMWLEGAVQSKWSISEMRHERWQALGGSKDDQPREGDVVEAEVDEDFSAPASMARELTEILHPGETARHDRTADREEADEDADSPAGTDFDPDESWSEAQEESSVRPIATLPDLPADVAEAFEAYKLAILRHKLSSWQE